MLVRPCALVVGSVGVLAASTASAAPLGPFLYNSFTQSPIRIGTYSYFHLETFEDGLFNTPGISASAGIVASGSSADSVDGDDGIINNQGTGRSWYSNGASVMEFTFDASALGGLPTHVGMVWTDVGQTSFGAFGFAPFVFEAFDANNLSVAFIGPTTLGDGQFTGQTIEDRFFGALNIPNGIARMRMTSLSSTDWEVDHIQYGRIIPAPASLPLLALGGLAASRRRR